MGGIKEELRKKRIYKNGCFYHPDKPNIVVGLSPYGLVSTRYSTGENHNAIVTLKNYKNER